MVQETMSILKKINRIRQNRGESGKVEGNKPSRLSIVNDTPEGANFDLVDESKTLVAPKQTLRIWSRDQVPDDYESSEGAALLETIAERIMHKFHRIDYAFSIETLRHYCWLYQNEDFFAALNLLASRGALKIEGERARLLTARERIRVA